MIEVKNLHKSFVKDVPVLNGIDCKIEDGEQIVVIGPSSAPPAAASPPFSGV